MRDSLAHVALISLAVTLAGCSDLCSNDMLKEASSPSGKFRAVAFSRNCGATTGFNVQVSVLEEGDSLPGRGGNALILDHTGLSSLAWRTESELVVTTLGEPRVFKKEAEVHGVRIALEQVRPNTSLERSRVE